MTLFALLAAASWLNISVPDRMTDWAFVDAQEQFVIATVPPWKRKEIVPGPVARCFDRCRSDYYRVRERATNDLQAMGPDVARWMFWCEPWHDAEVTLRCSVLLRRFSKCPDCHGKGFVGDDASWVTACRPCLGYGHFWTREFISDCWGK